MKLDGKAAVKIIEDLEIIRTSLAKLGARYYDDPEALAKGVCYFILDFDVFKKISAFHRMMTEAAAADDEASAILNDDLRKIVYWDPPQSISMNDIKIKMKEY